MTLALSEHPLTNYNIKSNDIKIDLWNNIMNGLTICDFHGL